MLHLHKCYTSDSGETLYFAIPFNNFFFPLKGYIGIWDQNIRMSWSVTIIPYNITGRTRGKR